ncbi:MipA/OmpV family protein [Variovorax sp. RHLX14]|uniref:MipA/OmpV family protein n=1 Tax=Variovorax sp. RHLX14 TaxID=1259731 RepID=UPI003F48B82C
MHHRRLFALALLLTALKAHALGGLILIDSPPKEGSTLAIGPTLAGYPEAPGSDRTKFLPLIGVDFKSATGGFISTDIGAGWNFSKLEELQFGARLWPVFGRTDDRSRARGLNDLGNRLGLGLFLNYEPWQFLVLQSSLLTGSGSKGNGTQFETGATLGAPLGDSVLLGLTLGTTWSNGAYLHSYFGVAPSESGRGSLPVFAPSAGRSDVNVSLNAEVRIAPRWKLTGQWLSARLIGDASLSPVTTSRIQNTFSVTLWYQLR